MGRRNTYPGIDEYAANLIHYKARQLCRQPGFSQEDQPDIEQELMFELMKRLPEYDPSRATHNAFVTWVVLQKIADLIEAQLTQKRDPRVLIASLNDLVSTDEEGWFEERWATVDIEEYLHVTNSTNRSTEERIDLDIDLDRAMANLPKELRRLCDLLAENSIAEVARKLGIARSTLYSAIYKLRKVFEKAGLKDYL